MLRIRCGRYIPDFLGDTLYFRDLYALYCTLYWVYNNEAYNGKIKKNNDSDFLKKPIEQSQEDNAEESGNENNNAEAYIKNYKNVLYSDMEHKSTAKKYKKLNNILAHLSALQINLTIVYRMHWVLSPVQRYWCNIDFPPTKCGLKIQCERYPGGEYNVLKTKRDAELELYRDFYEQLN